MGKFISITLKLPEEVHRKLKVASALSNKSMTQIIIDFVEKMKVTTPDFMQTGETKEPIKKEKSSSQYDPQVIREKVMELKATGLSYQGIADALTDEGVLTRQGGTWKPATIGNIIKKATATEGGTHGL